MNPITHLAIIMDGNGRWAEERGMPRWRGHEAGAHALRRAVEASCRNGISILTLYAFSSENWRRPAQEVHMLFTLFARYLIEERQGLREKGIRLSTIGRRDRLPARVRKELELTEQETREGTRLHLRLAIDYGARHEIVEAARALARKVSRGEIHPEEIDEDRFARMILTESIPDPDLIIRTAGEARLSNFLLWQAAYSELYFCQKLWPDFEEEDLEIALREFGGRVRRFGGLTPALVRVG